MKVSILLFVCAFLYGCCNSDKEKNRQKALKFSNSFCNKHSGLQRIHYSEFTFTFYCNDGSYGERIDYDSEYHGDIE